MADLLFDEEESNEFLQEMEDSVETSNDNGRVTYLNLDEFLPEEKRGKGKRRPTKEEQSFGSISQMQEDGLSFDDIASSMSPEDDKTKQREKLNKTLLKMAGNQDADILTDEQISAQDLLRQEENQVVDQIHSFSTGSIKTAKKEDNDVTKAMKSTTYDILSFLGVDNKAVLKGLQINEKMDDGSIVSVSPQNVDYDFFGKNISELKDRFDIDGDKDVTLDEIHQLLTVEEQEAQGMGDGFVYIANMATGRKDRFGNEIFMQKVGRTDKSPYERNQELLKLNKKNHIVAAYNVTNSARMESDIHKLLTTGGHRVVGFGNQSWNAFADSTGDTPAKRKGKVDKKTGKAIKPFTGQTELYFFDDITERASSGKIKLMTQSGDSVEVRATDPRYQTALRNKVEDNARRLAAYTDYKEKGTFNRFGRSLLKGFSNIAGEIIALPANIDNAVGGDPWLPEVVSNVMLGAQAVISGLGDSLVNPEVSQRAWLKIKDGYDNNNGYDIFSGMVEGSTSVTGESIGYYVPEIAAAIFTSGGSLAATAAEAGGKRTVLQMAKGAASGVTTMNKHQLAAFGSSVLAQSAERAQARKDLTGKNVTPEEFVAIMAGETTVGMLERGLVKFHFGKVDDLAKANDGLLTIAAKEALDGLTPEYKAKAIMTAVGKLSTGIKKVGIHGGAEAAEEIYTEVARIFMEQYGTPGKMTMASLMTPDNIERTVQGGVFGFSAGATMHMAMSTPKVIPAMRNRWAVSGMKKDLEVQEAQYSALNVLNSVSEKKVAEATAKQMQSVVEDIRGKTDEEGLSKINEFLANVDKSNPLYEQLSALSAKVSQVQSKNDKDKSYMELEELKRTRDKLKIELEKESDPILKKDIETEYEQIAKSISSLTEKRTSIIDNQFNKISEFDIKTLSEIDLNDISDAQLPKLAIAIGLDADVTRVDIENKIAKDIERKDIGSLGKYVDAVTIHGGTDVYNNAKKTIEKYATTLKAMVPSYDSAVNEKRQVLNKYFGEINPAGLDMQIAATQKDITKMEHDGSSPKKIGKVKKLLDKLTSMRDRISRSPYETVNLGINSERKFDDIINEMETLLTLVDSDAAAFELLGRILGGGAIATGLEGDIHKEAKKRFEEKLKDLLSDKVMRSGEISPVEKAYLEKTIESFVDSHVMMSIANTESKTTENSDTEIKKEPVVVGTVEEVKKSEDSKNNTKKPTSQMTEETKEEEDILTPRVEESAEEIAIGETDLQEESWADNSQFEDNC